MKIARIYFIFFLLIVFTKTVTALEPARYSIVAGKCTTEKQKIKITWCYNHLETTDGGLAIDPIYASAASEGTHTIFTGNKDFSVYSNGNLSKMNIYDSDCIRDVVGANCYISPETDSRWDIHIVNGGSGSDDEEMDGSCSIIYKSADSLSRCDEVVKDGYVKAYSNEQPKTSIRIPIN
ncbi:MAG: hypothetical protein K0R14_1409 [Burkholderiales bacterium]|jgi:hypothetical protein|nr:hypothetical protein [Burkholderiales bacterium]